VLRHLHDIRLLAVLVVLLGLSGARGADEKSATTPEAAAKADGHDDHKGGAHHDPHDLGHGNASSSLTSPADVKFDSAIYSFVVFMLLLLILGKFAWGPITEGLDKRERSIEDKIAEAHQSAHKAAEQLKQYEAKLAAAAEEAKEIAMGARREAEIARDQLLAEAKAGAQRERDRALEDIAAAKNLALQEIAEKSVNTAVRLASSLVQREIKPAEHAQLIREAVDTFPSAN
jgi:F-type H+-transporting ATPase subunit b